MNAPAGMPLLADCHDWPVVERYSPSPPRKISNVPANTYLLVAASAEILAFTGSPVAEADQVLVLVSNAYTPLPPSVPANTVAPLSANEVTNKVAEGRPVLASTHKSPPFVERQTPAPLVPMKRLPAFS